MGSETPPKLHVMFFPFMAQGHMIPTIDMARLFALRGVKSTILTTPINASNIFSEILRYQNSGLDISIVTIPFPSEESGLPEGCETVDSLSSRDMTMLFFESLVLLQPELERVLEQLHPDCLVSDMFLPWTTDVAKKHSIPRLVFHGMSFFSLCVYDSMKGYSPDECEGEDYLLSGLPDEIVMKKSQFPDRYGSKERFNQMMTKLMDKVRESETTSYGVLVNSFFELEPVYAGHYREALGRRTWHIGPVSLSNDNKAQRGKKAAIDEHYCLNWLNSKENCSVIYISFGSVSRFSSAQLMEIAEGLEASGVSFIWVLRKTKNEEDKKFLPDGFEERMEGKGLVIKDWAPQVLILDHRAIGGFVTHCGWNSILEGVSAGVPMITWPLAAEQFYNEVMITQLLKIGIKVGVEKWGVFREPGNVSATRERVEKVVRQLVKTEEGEEIRMRARGFKDMAKRAVEKEGSSYTDLTALIEELRQRQIIQNSHIQSHYQ